MRQARFDALNALLETHPGPTFVKSPELLEHLASASWLAVPIANPLPPADRSAHMPLRVVHPLLTEGPFDEEIAVRIKELVAAGVIVYERVPESELVPAITDADVVLSEFHTGDYGQGAVLGMSGGRIVLGHVHDELRARVDPPIIECTSDRIGDVLRMVARDPPSFRLVADRGPEFVATYYDGRNTVAELAEYLGLEPATAEAVTVVA